MNINLVINVITASLELAVLKYLQYFTLLQSQSCKFVNLKVLKIHIYQITLRQKFKNQNCLQFEGLIQPENVV